MATPQHKVKITPLEKDRVYQSAATDVTEFVLSATDISRQVDDGNFDIGLFVYDNMRLKMGVGGQDITVTGRFFDNNSASSIFKYKRDLAQVDIIYLDKDGAENTIFTGLVNDTLTNDDFDNGINNFLVTGRAGVFSKYAVIGGSVGDGMTVKQALKSLLDRPFITDYLTYNAANINPALDIAIDVGSELDNLSYKAALDKIMLASGSVMYIDSSNNIIVKDRSDNGNSPYKFYNSGDPLGRVNIIGTRNYNTGVQRSFNLCKIDQTVAKNDNLALEYGLRSKDIDVKSMITNLDTRQVIVDYYLENFAVPKQEVEVIVELEVAKDIELLDLCTIDIKPVVVNRNPDIQYSFPDKTPVVLNKRTISGNIGFKVIAKNINPLAYTATLKLREIGNKAGDSII